MRRPFQAFQALCRPQAEIYEEASEGRQFHAVYLLMLVLACLIALLGLLLNSPAVIIGAMLISPLMGPILSCALALSLADWKLGRKAVRNVALSVVETLVIAVIATALSPLKDATPEILARTQPNLMDLLVAFFSGLAGTLAFCSRSGGGLTILPGVAIATALMPPLATTGYGISTGQWDVARGSFMLFFTNFTAIVISADVVFFLAGFRPRRLLPQDAYSAFLRYRVLAAGATLALISVPLVRTLGRASEQAWARRSASAVLKAALDQPGRRALDSVDVRVEARRIVVQAAVRTVNFIDEAALGEMEVALATRLARPVELDLQQIQYARPEPEHSPAENPDFVGGAVVRTAVATAEPHFGALLGSLEQRVRAATAFLTEGQPGQSLLVHAVATEGAGRVRLELSCQRAEPAATEYWSLLAAALAQHLGTSVRLTGASLSPLPGGNALRFRGAASRAAASEVDRIAAAYRRWHDRSDLQLAFITSPGAAEELSGKRLLGLAGRFEGSLADPEGAPRPAERDDIAVYLLQRIEATSAPPSAPAAPPAPSPPSR